MYNTNNNIPLDVQHKQQDANNLERGFVEYSADPAIYNDVCCEDTYAI
jgi:hypothetical protein